MTDEYNPKRRVFRAPLAGLEHQQRRECWPLVIMAVMAIASSAAQAKSQNDMAKAQTESQQETVKANNAQAENQQAALRTQEAQQNESSARDANKALMLNRAEQSTANVAGAEAGVTGLSVDALNQSYEASRGRYIESVNRQGSWNAQGANAQTAAVATQTKLTNLSLNAPVQKANYAALGLKAGAGIFSDASTYYGWQTERSMTAPATPSRSVSPSSNHSNIIPMVTPLHEKFRPLTG